MPPKRPIGGSGDAGAAEAPEHGVEMETEVAVTAGEVSLHPTSLTASSFHSQRRSSTPTLVKTRTTTPATTPTTTPATTPTMTDNWLDIYTHLCVK